MLHLSGLNSPEDRHLPRKMNCTATPRTLNQEILVFSKTASVCMNSTTKFTAARSVISANMVLAAVDATSQTVVPLMVCSTTNQGRKNDVTLFFQINIDSVYSIIKVASVFNDIVANAHCQFVFYFLILLHHLKFWYRVSLGTHLNHL